MTRPTIPVVSYSDLIGAPGVRQGAIATLGQALETTGFFILEAHPVSPEVVRRAYQVAAQFFALPDGTKGSYALAPSQGGFSSFGSEQAKGYTLPDLKEFWHVNRQSLTTTAAPWPQEVPSFRPVMTRLYQQLMACAEVLLVACAEYLGQPSNWLVAMASGGDTVLRLAHYPPLGTALGSAGSLRAAPHEDINLITLLCEATAPGLEILVNGQWLPVQATPGQIVVDTGDMLQNLTNGLFKSTTHRVINPRSSNQARLSMPFFVHPRPEVDLTPLDSLVERTGGLSQFPPITAQAYLAQRLAEIQVGPAA